MKRDIDFIKAYEDYANALFRYCSFNVPDREVAKDIVQDTFTKTWNYICKGGKIDSLKSFLYKTLKNLIIDYYRVKKNDSLDKLVEEENFDPVMVEDVSIEEKIDSKIALQLLNKIPKEYRDIVVMRCMEDLSFKEIAEITEVAENTLAVRYYRAMKKVKEIFNKYER